MNDLTTQETTGMPSEMLQQPQTHRLVLRPAGMFSNVNEVVEHLSRAEAGGYRFFIQWQGSCYRDPAQPGDPWSYYFEPCFTGLTPEACAGEDCPELPTGHEVACTRDNVITPRLKDGHCNPLLLPKDRHEAHRLIAQYLRLKPAVTEPIERFVQHHFSAPVIGLHLRGPGRVDGGAGALRQRHKDKLEGGVPYDVYFTEVNRILAEQPGAKLLICSDSSQVVDRVRATYGARVIAHEASRSAFGEMHANHPRNQGLSFSPYGLGLDILIEAHLLARCDFFVHGNSNVANFVLCAAPDLEHIYVAA